jgi:hypothetical protein
MDWLTVICWLAVIAPQPPAATGSGEVVALAELVEHGDANPRGADVDVGVEAVRVGGGADPPDTIHGEIMSKAD